MSSNITATAPDGSNVSHWTANDNNVPTHVAALWSGGYTNIAVKRDGGNGGHHNPGSSPNGGGGGMG